MKELFNLAAANKRFITNLKIFAIGISTFYLILFLITSLIDPNHYKTSIEEWISSKIETRLILEGPLTWKAFPYLTITAKEVSLKENGKKSQHNGSLLKIKELNISPSIRYLIVGTLGLDIQSYDVKCNGYYFPIFHTKISLRPSSIKLTKIKLGLRNPKTIPKSKQKHHEHHQHNEHQDYEVLSIDKLFIDTSNEIPKYSLNHEDHHFPIAHLLLALDPNNKKARGKIEGNTYIKLDVTAEGRTAKELLKSINGIFNLEISNGRINGTDLISALHQAKSFLLTMTTGLTQVILSTLETIIFGNNHTDKFTPFDTLKFSSKIENGLLTNHDLQIVHKDYNLAGQGQVNLFHGALDYKIKAHYLGEFLFHSKKNDRNQKLLSTPLIVYLNGPYDKPNFKLDAESYVKHLKEGEELKKATNKVFGTVVKTIKKVTH